LLHIAWLILADNSIIQMSRWGSYAFVISIAALSGACASTGATPKPFPTPAPPSSASPPSSTLPRPSSTRVESPVYGGAALRYNVTGTALNLRGTPYRNGGTDPAGFDCSGFVKYVFEQNGISVPRTVGDQFRLGQQIDTRQLEAGDLVFFTTTSPGASHVGIVIGGDEFVHAPSSTGQVRVERLSAPYWSTRLIGARRVL
jgi:cell wall-associated NlpC family hydrolase